MLAQGQLPDTETLILQLSPIQEILQAKCFIFYNNDFEDNDIFLHFVPNNNGSLGTADNTNCISLTILAGKTLIFSPSYPIEYSNTNDAIFAKASKPNKVNYFILGVHK